MGPTPEHAVAREAVLDAAAAHCARGGDASAFEALVRKYHARVQHFVLRRGVPRSDAEDLTQEAFLRAWRAIGTFDPGGPARFSTWLFTIAARLAATHARDTAAAQRALDRAAWRRRHEEAGPKPASPEGVDLWALADATLGAETRAALWLRYAEDLSPEEIARVLNRSGVSVRVMLFRGRTRLARELGRPGKPEVENGMREGCHA